MMYICACCGEFARSDEEAFDSGTTLECPQCHGKTVLLLCTSEEYVTAVAAIAEKAAQGQVTTAGAHDDAE